MFTRTPLALVAAALTSLAACAPTESKQDAGTDREASIDVGPDVENPDADGGAMRFDGGTLTVEALTAARAAYLRGETRIDLDGDGRAEWVLTGRVGAGVATRETIDTHGNGAPDMVWDRTGTLHTYEEDHSGDGVTDFAIASRPATSDPTLLGRYQTAHPERFGKSAAVVRSQLGKVLRVADKVLPRPRGSGGVYAARLRELPERGRLADAVQAVMLGTRDEKHRGQLRTTLGRFLLWCDERRIRPDDCFEADLTAYRRALQRTGMKSTGAEIDAAKRLLRELGVLGSGARD